MVGTRTTRTVRYVRILLAAADVSLSYSERMGFERDAWRGAAQAYGAARAEKYGRFYKAWRTVQLLMIVALLMGIVIVWATR